MKTRIALYDIDGTLVDGSLVLNHAVNLHNRNILDLGDELVESWSENPKNEVLIRALAEKVREEIRGRKERTLAPKTFIKNTLQDSKMFYSTLEELKKLKNKGFRVVLISGSPDYLVRPFAEKLGVEYYSSTYLKDDEGRFTGEIEEMFTGSAKRRVIKQLGIENYDLVVGYGDTSSDIPILEVSHERYVVAPTKETIKFLRKAGIKDFSIISH